ncbi:S-layer homology domain-containing protein [Cytobacillus sp. FJAT-53684]|uniref:S-layer homology domain-containing protein n=1 Tax=Cytobacillus mangrovibacter TaxID=3299024 RepID=A0ABW6JX80_9BACI
MANQTKNYRKFVATSVTAALVASAVAPAAFAAEKVDFKDSIPAWAKDAVDYLVGKGAIQGYPDGTFNQAGKLTRGEAAKILALSLDLKVEETAKTDFADAKDHWASSYIAAIQKEKPGVIDGYNGKFNPNNQITRQEMAKMIVQAYGLKLDENADVSFSDNTGWGAEQVNILASQGVVEGDAGKFSPNADVTRGQAAAFVHRAEVKEVRKEVKQKDAGEAKVASVSAINGKQIEIKFSKAVDSTNIIDSNDQLMSGIVLLNGTDLNGNDAEFDEAGKVLTISLTNGADVVNNILDKTVEYAVVIQDVKTPDAEKIAKYTTVMKATETVVPTITKVESITGTDKTRAVTISFSEPVSFSSIKVNGKFVQSTTADAGFGKAYTLTTTEDLEAGKSYEVEVNNLKDALGNAAENILKSSVTVIKDTVKPTFTVSAVNEKVIDVVFDKKIDTASILVDSFKVTKKNSSGNDEIVPQDGISQLRPDGKTVRISLAVTPFNPANETSKEVTVTVKGIKDKLGNVVETKALNTTVVKDTVKPSISSVTVKPGLTAGQATELNLKFSEDVTGVDVTNASSQINLTDASGNAVKIPVGGVDTPLVANLTAVGGKVGEYTVKFGYETVEAGGATTFNSVELPQSGTYKLVLIQNTIADKAASANYNDAQVVSFTFSKPGSTINALSASIYSVADLGSDNAVGGNAGAADIATDSNTKRKLVVTFSENVVYGINTATGTYKDGAVNNPANYTIDGKALPVGVSINRVAATNSYVVDFSGITDLTKLPSALVNGGTVSFSVSGVKSLAGATLPYTTSAVTVADATAAELDSVYIQQVKTSGLVTSYVITADFNEELTTTGLDLDDFVLTGSTLTTGLLTGTPNASVALDSADKSKVVITITDPTDLGALNAAYATETFTFGTAGTTSTQDKAGVTIKINESKSVQKF